LEFFMVGAVATRVIHAEIGVIFVASAILAARFAVRWLRLAERNTPETVVFASVPKQGTVRVHADCNR
jgi:hypothetical protein